MLLALLAAVVVWTATGSSLPAATTWVDAALAALVLVPAALAVALVALPLADARGLLPFALGLAAVAWALDAAGAAGLFNAAKLLAFVLFGYWFVSMFEELWWIVSVALVIPWVDALSVAAGPTRVVVDERPDLLERVSVAFPLPGEDAASLGPPDVIFVALFLAAASRFGLRVAATFVATVALLGVTLVLTVALDLDGLPALPAVSLGFLLPNADLLWRRRHERGAGREPARPTPPA